jgi:lipopolysaccharide transport system ATP-binding protein
MYSLDTIVTPGFSVMTRASAIAAANARLAMMEFPKAAVIGVIGDVDAVPHDYMLDGLEFAQRLRVEAEIESRRRGGASVVVRSTDAHTLLLVSDEVWWISDGKVRQQGDPREVLREYQRESLKSLYGAAEGLPCVMRRGDGRAMLASIETLNRLGEPVRGWQSGDTARIRVTARFEADVEDPVIGIMIRTRIGMEVYGTNTELENVKLGPCRAGDTRAVMFEFECALCPQLYTITAASHDPDGVWHDWMEDAVSFSVADTRYTAGVANLRARVTCSRG